MCYDCNINFSEKRALRRHIKSKHEVINLGCEKCEYTTDRLDCLKRHIESKHYQNKIKCPECSVQFSRKDNLVRHKLEYHSKNPLTPMNRIQDDASTAFPLTVTPITPQTQPQVL